jgi:hypothetical protein
MKDDHLIPDLVLNETDYYHRLQEEALLFSRADFAGLFIIKIDFNFFFLNTGLEEISNDMKFIKYKNSRMMPIY